MSLKSVQLILITLFVMFALCSTYQ